MAQPDAAAARRKLETLVRTMEPVMEGVDRMIRRRRMLTPAGSKRKQPEPPARRPLSHLVTIDERRAELKEKATRLYEETSELDEVAAAGAAAAAAATEENHQGMQGFLRHGGDGDLHGQRL
ncbi:hypothetical protein PAHAL_5G063700 [Panicum hallii]|jgi:hypothetical protein|uniref:Uncharacterized protein n=1 Tax=Panicum hallii TaxID=206008 RepID=A0A2T8IJ71_9POAL|nr:hypothetical protein PAHAL_5G063700 [Panicum hallii]